MVYGYAHGGKPTVSEADLQAQVTVLKRYGVDKIYISRLTDPYETRLRFQFLLNSMEQGDTLVCPSIHTAFSSVMDLCETVDLIRQNGLRLCVIDSITVDCRNDRMDKSTQAYLEFCDIINDLTEAMIEAQGGSKILRRERKAIGRPRVTKADIPPLFMKYYPIYVSGGLNVSSLARATGLSRPTVYKYIRLLAD